MTKTWQTPHEGEVTCDISVDVSAIPDHIRDELANAVLQGFREFIKQPGSRELLDAGLAEKKKNAKGGDTNAISHLSPL